MNLKIDNKVYLVDDKVKFLLKNGDSICALSYTNREDAQKYVDQKKCTLVVVSPEMKLTSKDIFN